MVWQPEALEIRILKALTSRLDAIEKDILREKNRHEKSSINPSSQTILNSIGNRLLNSTFQSCLN